MNNYGHSVPARGSYASGGGEGNEAAGAANPWYAHNAALLPTPSMQQEFSNAPYNNGAAFINVPQNYSNPYPQPNLAMNSPMNNLLQMGYNQAVAGSPASFANYNQTHGVSGAVQSPNAVTYKFDSGGHPANEAKVSNTVKSASATTGQQNSSPCDDVSSTNSPNTVSSSVLPIPLPPTSSSQVSESNDTNESSMQSPVKIVPPMPSYLPTSLPSYFPPRKSPSSVPPLPRFMPSSLPPSLNCSTPSSSRPAVPLIATATSKTAANINTDSVANDSKDTKESSKDFVILAWPSVSSESSALKQ